MYLHFLFIPIIFQVSHINSENNTHIKAPKNIPIIVPSLKLWLNFLLKYIYGLELLNAAPLKEHPHYGSGISSSEM